MCAAYREKYPGLFEHPRDAYLHGADELEAVQDRYELCMTTVRQVSEGSLLRSDEGGRGQRTHP